MLTLTFTVLMFVFWYCHKRGKEVRLAKEGEGDAATDLEAEDTVDEEDDDNDDDGNVHDAEKELGESGKFEDMLKYQEMQKDIDAKADTLSQPNPPKDGEC